MDRLDKINDEIQKDTSLVRDIDVLKEKVKTLFELWNQREKK